MEEGAEGIVWMRHVNVAELRETGSVVLDRLKATNRDLDVDDGLCREIRNGGRAVMVNPDGEIAQHSRDPTTLQGERIRPGRVVGHDL
jgi:hypothetical protein